MENKGGNKDGYGDGNKDDKNDQIKSKKKMDNKDGIKEGKKDKNKDDHNVQKEWKHTSPPLFLTFDDFMKASTTVANLALAHEIMIDDNFRLEKTDSDKSGLGKLKETMMAAFWDVLASELYSVPPKYDQALSLLIELRKELKGLLLENQRTIRTQIDEQLDIDLIKQQLNENALDITKYGNFVITTMGRLCAPVRDDDIAKLKQLEEPVSLYREIFKVIDLMKMDMANFTIAQMRPYIQQQSVSYEKIKFKEFLEAKKKVNSNGIILTKEWLYKAYQSYNPAEYTDNNGESSSSNHSITPSKLLNSAYLDLLFWDNESTFPECCVMDVRRFGDIGKGFKQLTLISALILITLNIYRKSSNPTELKETLKTHCLAILVDTKTYKEFTEKAENLAIVIEKDVKADVQKSRNTELSATNLTELKNAIIQGVHPENLVHKLLTKRLRAFIFQILLSNHRESIKIPQGFSTVQPDMKPLIGLLMRIVAHNRDVFGEYYDNIIHEILPSRGAAGNA